MTDRPRLRLAACLMIYAATVLLRSWAADESERPYPHGNFTGDCTMCHQTDQWVPAKTGPNFKHTARFPLAGAHKTAGCRDCHLSLDFQKAPTACADCHQDPHLGEMGTDCARCHTPRNFIDRSRQLESHRATRFPLTGSHATVECESCHPGRLQGQLRWVNTPVDCQACHIELYNGTTDPNHVAAGFPKECVLCHTPTTWTRARFDHNGTRFPLTGAHRALPCASCHQNGYSGTPTDCYSCHQADYNATTDPNHSAAGFPTDCAQCHNTTSWAGAQFNHAATGFPLTGAHQTLACNSCHRNGYSGTPTDCYSCHQADYNATTDPNHSAAGFPTDCAQCHNTTSWAGAQFNHATTGFPLTGAHQTLACNSCHQNGYSGTPTDCYSCHQADYNGTTDPNHSAAGYPTDCAQCHNTTSWGGAR